MNLRGSLQTRKHLKHCSVFVLEKSQNLDVLSSHASDFDLPVKSNSLNLKQSPPIILGRGNSQKVLQSLLEMAILELNISRPQFYGLKIKF